MQQLLLYKCSKIDFANSGHFNNFWSAGSHAQVKVELPKIVASFFLCIQNHDATKCSNFYFKNDSEMILPIQGTVIFFEVLDLMHKLAPGRPIGRLGQFGFGSPTDMRFPTVFPFFVFLFEFLKFLAFGIGFGATNNDNPEENFKKYRRGAKWQQFFCHKNFADSLRPLVRHKNFWKFEFGKMSNAKREIIFFSMWRKLWILFP